MIISCSATRKIVKTKRCVFFYGSISLSLEDILKVSVGQRARVVLIQKKGPRIGEKEVISGRVDAVTDKAFIIDGRTYPRAVWDLAEVDIFSRA